MTNFIRASGLYYLSWNDWVAMGEQRSAVGFLAEWLETSPRVNRHILENLAGSKAEKQTLSGLQACCPDAHVEYLTQTVSLVSDGHSVIALCPDEKDAQDIIDEVDPRTADMCVTLGPSFDHLELWLEAHGAIQLPSGMPADTRFMDRLAPVVRAALLGPLEVMTETGGLAHGVGRGQMVQTLRLLHNSGYRYNKYDLQRYAYRLGYRQRDVAHLGQCVDSILKNRFLIAEVDLLPPDALDIWKSVAGELQ